MIFVFIALIIFGIGLVAFIIRRDLSRESASPSGFSFYARSEKSYEGRISSEKLLKAPLSKVPCVGFRFEVRQPYDKTVFNKKGQPGHHKSWDILFSGQKVLPFAFQMGQGSLTVNIEEADLSIEAGFAWSLPHAGDQEKEDLLQYIKDSRDDKNPAEPAFFSRVETLDTAKHATSPEHLDDSSLYILEAVYQFGDNVTVTSTTAPEGGRLKARSISKIKKS